MTPVSELTYKQAVLELDAILKAMQSPDCDIDTLAANTRRAGELLKECRARLKATDAELADILKSLQ